MLRVECKGRIYEFEGTLELTEADPVLRDARLLSVIDIGAAEKCTQLMLTLPEEEPKELPPAITNEFHRAAAWRATVDGKAVPEMRAAILKALEDGELTTAELRAAVSPAGKLDRRVYQRALLGLLLEGLLSMDDNYAYWKAGG